MTYRKGIAFPHITAAKPLFAISTTDLTEKHGIRKKLLKTSKKLLTNCFIYDTMFHIIDL